jgi:hypothetical protein
MASKRQITANRRNGRKSTGPRSASGKKQSSQNSFRHGLSKPLPGVDLLELETLSRQIVGERKGEFAMELARSAAEAEIELARVRHLKVDLIQRIAGFANLDASKLSSASTGEGTWIKLQDLGARVGMKRLEFAMASLPALPVEEPERTAEAVRRALPELVRLVRYETRAAARRDRAIRALARSERK